jgi:putative ABC transport system substrate-binding protein
MKTRRMFIGLLGGAVAWPAMARAQSTLPEVGYLYTGSASALPSRIAAFHEGLRSRGYVDGRNMTVVTRSAESRAEHFEPLVAELVERNVRVLFAAGPAVVRSARKATTTIPIVAMDLESDPVKSGLVESTGRPGGNLTGLFFDFPGFGGKWLELLTEAVPKLSRLALVWDPSTESLQLDAISAEAISRGLSLQIVKAASAEAFEQALQAASRERADGLIILSSPLFGSNARQLADLTARLRLPAVTLFPEFAHFGGLMAYGTHLAELYRQAGALVAKVLSGARPRDLPIERPNRFHLVINLRTAKALGLVLAPTLLARADEVIE